RTDQPNGDRRSPLNDAARDPAGTLLGREQADWLTERLTTSAATWNVLAQQVMMARVDREAGPKEAFSMDQWPGYEFERQRVLRHFHEARVANPVVLTGDIHSHWANELRLPSGQGPGGPVAVEFVGTSISSGGDGTARPAYLDALQRENPFVKFHNAERGYVLCEVSPGRWETQFRTVEYVTRPGAPVQSRARFTVEAGRSQLLPG
ncbi:MAG: alkaline phosphatase D family protein, partial [Verrucomicrobiota bacterium]